jgi:hypothetical protein
MFLLVENRSRYLMYFLFIATLTFVVPKPRMLNGCWWPQYTNNVDRLCSFVPENYNCVKHERKGGGGGWERGCVSAV